MTVVVVGGGVLGLMRALADPARELLVPALAGELPPGAYWLMAQ